MNKHALKGDRPCLKTFNMVKQIIDVHIPLLKQIPLGNHLEVLVILNRDDKMDWTCQINSSNLLFFVGWVTYLNPHKCLNSPNSWVKVRRSWLTSRVDFLKNKK